MKLNVNSERPLVSNKERLLLAMNHYQDYLENSLDNPDLSDVIESDLPKEITTLFDTVVSKKVQHQIQLAAAHFWATASKNGSARRAYLTSGVSDYFEGISIENPNEVINVVVQNQLGISSHLSVQPITSSRYTQFLPDAPNVSANLEKNAVKLIQWIVSEINTKNYLNKANINPTLITLFSLLTLNNYELEEVLEADNKQIKKEVDQIIYNTKISNNSTLVNSILTQFGIPAKSASSVRVKCIERIAELIQLATTTEVAQRLINLLTLGFEKEEVMKASTLSEQLAVACSNNPLMYHKTPLKVLGRTVHTSNLNYSDELNLSLPPLFSKIAVLTPKGQVSKVIKLSEQVDSSLSPLNMWLFQMAKHLTEGVVVFPKKVWIQLIPYLLYIISKKTESKVIEAMAKKLEIDQGNSDEVEVKLWQEVSKTFIDILIKPTYSSWVDLALSDILLTTEDIC